MRLSIRMRLVLAAAIQILVLVLVGAIGYRFLQQSHQADAVYEATVNADVDLQKALRGVGELLLTDGSSTSRKLTQDSIREVDTELVRLKAAAEHTDEAIGRAVSDELAPQWTTLKSLAEQILARKKLSTEDTDAMLLFGKVSAIGATLSSKTQAVVYLAQAAGQAATQRLAWVIGLGVLALLASLLLSSLILFRTIMQPLNLAVNIAERIAGGDVGTEIRCDDQPAEMTRVLRALGEMQASLAGVVAKVRAGSEGVASASSEIAQGNNNLSARTEQQSSAIEETAASMEELSATVRKNADNAGQANQLAIRASTIAVTGGEVVGQVVETMKDINDASKKIADIIGVIDGIAFQTNILALKAAVEAARAGDQGRGFAVVATEVRSLAGRSAEAAKEIKTLINASVERVTRGSTLVDQAGLTMTEVVSNIRRVTDIMGEISAASSEQALGVAQVSEAITSLDQTTQQNAALVEQMSAAASTLNSQAGDLVQAVSVFKLAGTRKSLADQTRPPPAIRSKTSVAVNQSRPRPLPKRTPVAIAAPAGHSAAAASGEWESF